MATEIERIERLGNLLGVEPRNVPDGLYVRWMIGRDLDSVLAIESQCFANPLDEQQLRCYLRQRDHIGMVVEHRNRVLGYMIYGLTSSVIEVERLAVDPAFHRCGIGAEMANKLIRKIEAHTTRHTVSIHVRESNLRAQLFFRAMGFRAAEVIRDWFDDTNECAFRFVSCAKECE